jgi:enoyl-[acyl-carrier-protein] reductase (NADH)
VTAQPNAPVTRLLDLTGQVALVTGAGSPTGIGFATARLLGALGAAVALLCVPGASYTTGQVLLVDCGNSIAEERA